MKRKPRSAIHAAVHESISGLRKAGVVDKATMRRFDLRCLTRVEDLSPADIRQIREANNVSQAVFANCLNVDTGLVSKWERGEKTPSGPSLKLLSIVKAKGIDAIV